MDPDARLRRVSFIFTHLGISPECLKLRSSNLPGSCNKRRQFLDKLGHFYPFNLNILLKYNKSSRILIKTQVQLMLGQFLLLQLTMMQSGGNWVYHLFSKIFGVEANFFQKLSVLICQNLFPIGNIWWWKTSIVHFKQNYHLIFKIWFLNSEST